MKNSLPHAVATASAAALLLVAAGCESPGSPQAPAARPTAAASATGTGNNDVTLTFSDNRGVTRSLSVPRRLPNATSRGYDAEGNFVSLGTLKGYAVEAYNTGTTSREMEVRYKLNRFDGETIEIVVNALLRAGASAPH